MKRFFALVCALLLLTPISALAQWRSLGPYGGNARALAYNPASPDQILLGSGAGTLFESLDGGRQWRPFAHLGSGNELMLETIAFDPANTSTIYVAGWSVSGSGGGFFVTRDGGKTWDEPVELRGKSIQAVALAKSDPRILVAGALDGLYRSKDSGRSWELISPAGHPDLKNFESVVIDPNNPNIIYAGTWHLPWKTTDGGATWYSIKKGVIDDSDVFSIILDFSNPQTVMASACSGIYKSENGGQLFHKVQGIPGTARRTRILQQDPQDSKTVYAGTTEGLFKTTDGGKTFVRITPSDFILNEVLVDPRNSRRLLIATDRGGVFSSDDAGATFHPSNDGFSQRQITTMVADSKETSDLYVGVVNDKEFGGVFHAHNGLWSQMSEGLDGRDVFDLGMSPERQLFAATNRGVLFYDRKTRHWNPSRIVTTNVSTKGRAGKIGKGNTRSAKSPAAGTGSVFNGGARAIAFANHRVYAATDAGVFHSDNEGASWNGGPVLSEKSIVSISAHDHTVVAASLREVWYSGNYAQSWTLQPLPRWVTRIYSVSITSDSRTQSNQTQDNQAQDNQAQDSQTQDDRIWLCTRDGLLRWNRKSMDQGEWERVLNGLPAREVTSLHEQGGTLLATVAGSNEVYESHDRGESWQAAGPGATFELTGAMMQGETMYVITRNHGVLVRESDVRAGALQ